MKTRCLVYPIVLGSLGLLTSFTRLHAQTFLPPTPEELSLTAVPEAPGATAIILYKEEITDDALRSNTFYTRIKILTEGGKDMATVEMPTGGKIGVTLDTLNARTIHADGTIIPLTTKPYDKLIEKVEGYKYKARVFTMPSVEVGSIIEYRYTLHYDDAYYSSPDWFIQSDYFTRKAHYQWTPKHNTSSYIVDSRGNVLDHVRWAPILPQGAAVVQKIMPAAGNTVISLDVANIKPIPHEEFMPPLASFSYRVLFYYTGYKSVEEFWEKEGKNWSQDREKFIGPKNGVKQAVAQLVAPSDSPDVKLHKIYAAVQAMDNTDFSREHSAQEDQASGLKLAQSTDDILARKRGSGDQLTDLFVAMARAAGLKAYLADVTDRSESIFFPSYLTMSQLNDYIAIVNVDGKDQYFDPGQRYCAFGHLSWKHVLAGGVRQLEKGGTGTFSTPALSSYKESATSRIADLDLDEHGIATGKVTVTFNGNPALQWRQTALRGDETELKNQLRRNLERELPGGMDVKVTSVENITDAELPLKVAYEIKGPVGSSTGKRLLLPADIFETNTKPRFPHPIRELAIDMHYPSLSQDAVRFKLPAGVVIESAPAADTGKLGIETNEPGKVATVGTYEVNSAKSPSAITLYRNVIIGNTLFYSKEYSNLRTFYSKLEAKDQESVVLTRPAASPGAGGN